MGELCVTENENVDVELETLREATSGPSRCQLERKLLKMRREKVLSGVDYDLFDDKAIDEIRILVREDTRRLLKEIDALAAGEKASILELRRECSVLEDERWSKIYKRKKRL